MKIMFSFLNNISMPVSSYTNKKHKFLQIKLLDKRKKLIRKNKRKIYLRLYKVTKHLKVIRKRLKVLKMLTWKLQRKIREVQKLLHQLSFQILGRRTNQKEKPILLKVRKQAFLTTLAHQFRKRQNLTFKIMKQKIWMKL